MNSTLTFARGPRLLASDLMLQRLDFSNKSTLLGVISLICALLVSASSVAQEADNTGNNDVHSIFDGTAGAIRGYGAISNKFTTIRDEYANLVEVYGGVFINRKLMLGIGGAGLTNRISVPAEYRVDPLRDMCYAYGQFGLMSEYILASSKPFHLAFSLFSGPGFTVQYEREDWTDDFDHNKDESGDTNWFFVAEPGVQFEINILKWMRFSPGVSYRATFGSDGLGMKDSNISNSSYNATLKFGAF